jgi:hypothetical protein
MFDVPIVLLLAGITLPIVCAALWEVRRRYVKARLDQKLCQLSRDAML